MTDLLTTRQIQDILKVDRITVYRMLNDGRLKGVKIGQQWRFPADQMDQMIGIRHVSIEEPLPALPDGNFPAHCAQTIQDLFAEVSQISALIVDMQGNPLTQVSNPTRFCQIVLSSALGKSLGHASWQSFAVNSQAIQGSDGRIVEGARFFTCQAGLQYIGAPIYDKEKQVGLFLAGQFYWQPPDPREESERLRRLCAACDIPLEMLQAAAREIPVIDPSQHTRVESWPFTAARAIQSILQERLCFVERLQHIADLTQI